MVSQSAVGELKNGLQAFLLRISSLPPFFGDPHSQSQLQILKRTLLCSVHARY